MPLSRGVDLQLGHRLGRGGRADISANVPEHGRKVLRDVSHVHCSNSHRSEQRFERSYGRIRNGLSDKMAGSCCPLKRNLRCATCSRGEIAACSMGEAHTPHATCKNPPLQKNILLRLTFSRPPSCVCTDRGLHRPPRARKWRLLLCIGIVPLPRSMCGRHCLVLDGRSPPSHPMPEDGRRLFALQTFGEPRLFKTEKDLFRLLVILYGLTIKVN